MTRDQIILAGFSAGVPILAGFVKMILEMRRDLDQAFNKIRNLESNMRGENDKLQRRR